MGIHRTVILLGDARQMTERIRQLEAVGMNHLMILANFGALAGALCPQGDTALRRPRTHLGFEAYTSFAHSLVSPAIVSIVVI